MFKVVYCKCRDKIVLIQCMPDAEKDPDMQKSVRKLFNSGYDKVAYIETFKPEDFESCIKCKPVQLEIEYDS